VDHVARGKLETRRDLGLSGVAAAELGAGLAQFRSRGAVDGAVDPAAAEQCLIGGVDDGVEFEPGNIALDDGDAMGHDAIARPNWPSIKVGARG
jgi:hypothetical protein